MTTLLVYYENSYILFLFFVALDLILYHVVIEICVAKSRNLCIWPGNDFFCVLLGAGMAVV